MFPKSFDPKKHFRKTARLVVITILWCVLTLIAMSLIKNEPLTPKDFLHQLLTFENGWLTHLWFLQQLCVIYILFPLLKNAYDSPNKEPLRTFGAVISVILLGNGMLTILFNTFSCLSFGTIFYKTIYNFFNNFNPFPSGRSHSLVYFILGGLIMPRCRQAAARPLHKIIAFAVLLFSTALTTAYGVLMSLTGGSLFNTVGLNYYSPLVVINVICVVILFQTAPPKNRCLTTVINTISQNTLGIYLLHIPLGTVLKLLIGNRISRGLTGTIIFSSLLLFLSLILTLLCRKIPLVRQLFRF